jgi:hypothetical protein
MPNELALLSFLVSPLALAALGRAVGLSGAWALVWLAGVFGLHLLGEGLREGRRAVGPGYPEVLEKISFLLLFPFWCALLAGSAGYAFNEVFVSWFPNLGFSFLALFAAGACAALGGRRPWPASSCDRVAPTACDSFAPMARGLTVTDICGLAVLALTAFLAAAGVLAGKPVLAAGAMAGTGAGPLAALGSFPVVLLGAGLAGPGRSRSTLVLAALSLAAWAGMFLVFVDPARLADSSVPHMLLARTVLGQAGRVAAGVLVIAACVGGMAVFMRSLAVWAADLAAKRRMRRAGPAAGWKSSGVTPENPSGQADHESPAHSARPSGKGDGGQAGRLRPERAFVQAVAALSILEAAALGLGYAGEDVTWDLVSGGTAAWLLALGLGSLTSPTWPGRPRRSVRSGDSNSRDTSRRLRSLLVLAGYATLAALAVTATDDQAAASAYAVFGLALAAVVYLYRKYVAA